MAEKKLKSKKTILLMAGGFLLSFVVICVGMYFLLKMTQPLPPATELAQGTATTDTTAKDTTRALSEKIDSTTTPQSEESKTELAANALPEDSTVVAAKAKESAENLQNEKDTTQTPLSEAVAPPDLTESTSDSNGQELKALIQKGPAFDPNRITRLARIFEAMKPKQAAPVMSQLDNEVIVMILMKMKERAAAKILGEMSVERAASISRQISQKVLES
jgi:flagellar motility protein MotE (MotC chaperone)